VQVLVLLAAERRPYSAREMGLEQGGMAMGLELALMELAPGLWQVEAAAVAVLEADRSETPSCVWL
jgi:hypothetical protein